MKKLLIIVVACTLHTHFTQGMIEAIYDAGTSLIQYAAKKADPDKYILDAENEDLYRSMLDVMDKNDISALRLAQFRDRKDTLQTFEYTFGRVLDRLNTTSNCILQQSFIQDPLKTKSTKLSSIIDVNWLITPILFDALAIRALQEQKNPKKSVPNTKSLIVDVLLHKISLLSETERYLLKCKLDEDCERFTVEQQRDLAEKSYFSLPEDEQGKLFQKMSEKKSAAITIMQPKEKSPEHSASFVPGSFGKEDSVELRPTNKKEWR